jgi:hypothetical protein
VLLRHRVFVLMGSLIAAPCVFAQAIPPRVTLVEELRLDANKEDFSNVGLVVVSQRGRMAIAFGQDHLVRIYEPDGRLVAKVGRRGMGPGEFEMFGNIGWMADTVWVGDISQRRTTLISPDGKVLRTVPDPITPAYEREEGAQPRPTGKYASIFATHAMLPNGSMLGNALLTQSDAQGKRLRAYMMVPPSGEPRTLVSFPEDGRRSPLLFQTQVIFDPDGSGFAKVTVDSMAVAGGTYTITRTRFTGEQVFSRSFPYTGVKLSQGEIDAALARMMPSRGSEGDEPAIRKQVEAQQIEARKQIPPVRVPINGARFGLDGTMWVYLPIVADTQTLLILNSRGTVVNSLALPKGKTFAAGSATHVWLREADADGLTSVVRYRMTRTGCLAPGCR